MRVCILYSGGKDSNLALLKAYNIFRVVCLVSIFPRSVENSLFHYPNINLVRFQSEALGIPLLTEESLDDEESNLEALYRVLGRAKEKYQIEGVVTGAIRSTYQASRFQRVCWDLDLWCFNPLWLTDQISLLKEALNSNFEVIFTRIAGYPLKKDLVGKKLDYTIIEYFKKISNILNPAGEGGEYETLVLDMPLFRKKLEILNYEVVGDDYDATLIVKDVRLVSK